MKKVLLFMVLFLPFPAYAQQAPFGRPDIPISSRDRVYAADQTSNTVSVIDPSRNELLGVIRLGNPVPGSLSPLYTAPTPGSDYGGGSDAQYAIRGVPRRAQR